MKKASLTVEASLIMPVVIGIVFLCVYMGFFLYNRACMQLVLSETMIQSLKLPDTDLEEQMQMAEENCLQELKIKLVGIKNLEVGTVYSGNKAEGYAKADMAIVNFGFMYEEAFSRIEQIKVKEEILLYRPKVFVQNCRKLERLIQSGQEENK